MEGVQTGAVRRVLFFDSGVGGLSVYRDVKEVNPDVEGFYLFDNECFPYGTKSPAFLENRVVSLIDAACRRLRPAAAVIACNTASTVVLPFVRERISIPVIGVVPAIKPAARLSQKKVIALLATPGTVSRPYTDELIKKYASDCKVIKLGTPVLASIAESRLSTGTVDRKAIEQTVKPLMELKGGDRPDVAVLGCTHYPFIADVLQQLMPDVRFIDSGNAIGRRVRQVLSALGPESFEKPGQPLAFYTGNLDSYADRLKMVRNFGFADLQQF